jgi:hypothetical protein
MQVMVFAVGERNGYGWRQPAIGTALVEHLAQGANVNGVVLEQLDESVLEGVGANAIEQTKQSGPVATYILVALV